MSENEKTRSISVRLLKEGVEPEHALKEAQKLLKKIELTGKPADKMLYAGQIYSKSPKWLSFFKKKEQQKLDELMGASPGAVLFNKVKYTEDEQEKERWLVFTFGMGFLALRPEKLQTGFGRRVALNKIGKTLIRSVDTKKPEESTLQTRVQNSKSADIFDFGIDMERIILHSITGKCQKEDSFGTTVTGNDTLKLNTKVTYATLDAKCQEIMEAYTSTRYQEVFSQLENIVPVKDLDTINSLDAELIDRLRRQDTSLIHLAPPEIIDYQDFDKFKYTTSDRRHDGLDDIDIESYLSTVTPIDLTIDDLKTNWVKTSIGEDERFHNKWTIYKCIAFEIEKDGYLYVLSNGEWYQVATSFVEKINEAYNTIPESTVELPDYNDEDEKAYNLRASGASDSLLHFDRDMMRFEGERGTVEFCDLFSKDKKIIHVKKRGSSSDLSHHFFQGYVSAEALLEDQQFRKQVRESLNGNHNLVPLEQPAPNEYEVVYALIYDTAKNVPFFSKVALNATYKQLRRMRFNASIKWIAKVG